MRIESMTDEAIAAQIGEAIKAYRLRKDMKQEDLAQEIGVSKPTVVHLEQGQVKLSVLIAALRALRKLDLLESLTSPPRPSPLMVARMEGKDRLRASSKPSGRGFKISKRGEK